MSTKSAKITALSIGLAIFLSSIACQSLYPKRAMPGSLEERIADGDIRFTGSGNVTYIGCQDPTAAVRISIGSKTKEVDGTEFYDYVNPVRVNAITDGRLVKMEECEKTSIGDKYDWSAKGIYYPKDAKIVFTTCTRNNARAEGQAYLVGDGFEGEYACYDRDDGALIYKVAISAYEMSE